MKSFFFCHPRTTWRPLTLGQPGSASLCVSLEVFCHADWAVPRQDVNSSFRPCVCHPRSHRCLHTCRFGTVASPPPVPDLPWGPHPPGHQVSNLSSAKETVLFLGLLLFLQTASFDRCLLETTFHQ